MRRSEMIEHIAQELLYVAVDEGLYKTAHHGYFQRKAADLLDMIEGFGMQPPKRIKYAPTAYAEPNKRIVYEWEDEE